jgi:acyl-ACP thioesterase
LYKKDEDTKRIGRSEFWLALTRPYGPAGKRTPDDVPEGIKIMKEHEPTEDDLGSRDIEDYRVNGETRIQETQTVVFHMDQSDQYRHINTNKYMDRALDLLGLQCHKAGGDVGRLRFHEITIYFRKPFVPGDVAEVDSDFVLHKDSFHGAVRFYHSNNGTRSDRISMAMETRGPLVT